MPLIAERGSEPATPIAERVGSAYCRKSIWPLTFCLVCGHDNVQVGCRIWLLNRDQKEATLIDRQAAADPQALYERSYPIITT